MADKIEFVPDPQSKDKLASIIQEGVGAASMCWEDIEKAGVFKDQQALAVANAMTLALHKYYHIIPKGGNG